MSLLVSFDPGLRMSGVAVFRDGELVWAQLARSDDSTTRGASAWSAMGDAVVKVLAPVLGLAPMVAEYACEHMQVYTGQAKRRDPERVDPADLIELAGVGGYVGGILGATHSVSYLPREWKGQVPKPIHQAKFLRELSVFEQERIRDTKGERADLRDIVNKQAVSTHPLRNTMDAVGIGLFHLGRIKGLGTPRRAT